MRFWKLCSLFLLLVSCSGIDKNQKLRLVDFEVIREIKPDFPPEKCVYNFIAKTAYIWQKDTNLIHFFQEGIHRNTIGGLGFEQQNFSKLSDIALAPDGSLLALDSFSKSIKKFNQHGRYITQISLPGITEPTLFDISTDERIFVYDAARNEIKIFQQQIEKFNFGSFHIKSPINLSFQNRRITLHDKINNETLIFSDLGNFLNKQKGYLIRENENELFLKSYFIDHPESGRKFCQSVSKWNRVTHKNGYTILISDNKVLIGRFRYENF